MQEFQEKTYHNRRICGNIVFDIGATTSIMSEKVARKHVFEIMKSNAKVRVADNRIIGETKKLDVNIKGHCCKLSFVI